MCASALACSGHVDDVGASLCGRTIIQRARGWIVESVVAGRIAGKARENLAGRWYAEKEGAAEGAGRGVVRGGRFHAVDCWTCSSTPVEAAFGHSPAYAPSIVLPLHQDCSTMRARVDGIPYPSDKYTFVHIIRESVNRQSRREFEIRSKQTLFRRKLFYANFLLTT